MYKRQFLDATIQPFEGQHLSKILLEFEENRSRGKNKKEKR
jgi:hypothetical protein